MVQAAAVLTDVAVFSHVETLSLAADVTRASALSTDLARAQTAISLAFHICFAVFGVGMPWLLLFVEGRWVRTRDPVWLALTRKWSKAFAVLFAVGAVSGTALSFEFGLLWPAFMARYGGVLGLSFTLEGFAFFTEAIFIGMYLYGWKRLSPRAHWMTLWPIAIAGTMSTLFIITANAWMNTPGHITEVDGKVVSAEPFAPFLAATAPHQLVHMLLAALMCTGGIVAGVYAVGLLRGRRDAYHQRGLRVGLTVLLVCAPLQLVVGDIAARVVGEKQPIKLAAMEGIGHTQTHAPLTIGGIYDEETGEVRHGIEIPNLLSLMEGFSADHEITGLSAVPPEERPDARQVHLAFNVMVGLGCALIAFAGATGIAVWRRRRRGERPLLPTGRSWLWAAVASGPASVAAMMAGWEVTEGGRQPWIVYGRMRVDEAVTTTEGMPVIFAGTVLLYLGLAVALVLILRRMATGGPVLGGAIAESTTTPDIPDARPAPAGQPAPAPEASARPEASALPEQSAPPGGSARSEASGFDALTTEPPGRPGADRPGAGRAGQEGDAR
ncbi:cytochrome d ubiquinol oxidase subunit I [Parafrankia irregularis]|uniref:Cytochrome d ubiquinol oxidase subunit I n=1 Tax=Parafrankia irregularis TaxID=795642 RepID=A0A0S4QY59_9ACTN|nr:MULTISPECIES: cytochrome ubiquinol oxidase subunit I [Parafrankia]MBE3203579.1 cytochrome ubiquinol oxidase subunit I [Parafrankia sp. CH37]CUU60477.1 cytochrome d ubiquinol oxidase subunit I [Parafrankia irregularis]